MVKRENGSKRNEKVELKVQEGITKDVRWNSNNVDASPNRDSTT